MHSIENTRAHVTAVLSPNGVMFCVVADSNVYPQDFPVPSRLDGAAAGAAATPICSDALQPATSTGGASTDTAGSVGISSAEVTTVGGAAALVGLKVKKRKKKKKVSVSARLFCFPYESRHHIYIHWHQRHQRLLSSSSTPKFKRTLPHPILL
jgi:hypothetical protein